MVGFHGMGGRELFGSEFAVAIDDGDVGALATWIERFVAEYDKCRDEWERRGAEATDFVRSTYSRERATTDLVACFGAITSRRAVTVDARDCARTFRDGAWPIARGNGQFKLGRRFLSSHM